MKIILSPKAQDDMAKLSKEMGRRMLEKLYWFAGQDDPLSFAEPLQGSDKMYRFRIGEHRAIFYLEGNRVVIVVVAVKHRGKVYRRL